MNRYHYVGYVLIGVGLVFLLTWKTHAFFYNRSLSLSDALTSQQTVTEDFASRPLYIDIPSIPKLPVVEAGKIQGTWAISPKSANHVRQSAIPGEKGNIIIYGHNTDAVFGKLAFIKNGDVISITSANGALHRYKVVTTTEVNVSDVQLLQPTGTEALTLYTCSGWFDSKRFVVRATPIY
jgi:LPXTG-site transpeptidase (sortase) family protein